MRMKVAVHLVVGLTIITAALRADAAYDSGGFDDESRFVAHMPLESQDGGAWLSAAGPTTTAYVRDASLAPPGSTGQVVEVFRGGDEWGEWYVPGGAAVTPPHTAAVVEWSLYVEPSGSTADNFFGYGPMFGVIANHDGAAFTRLGGVFVDAYDGLVLVMDPAAEGAVTPTQTTVALDAWNTFRMVLDFSAGPSAAVSLYLNGAATPFYVGDFADAAVPGADLSGISDVSIFASGSSDDAESQAITGYAYFDDYRITSLTPVPEPVSAALAGLAAVFLLARTKKQ